MTHLGIADWVYEFCKGVGSDGNTTQTHAAPSLGMLVQKSSLHLAKPTTLAKANCSSPRKIQNIPTHVSLDA